MLKLTDALSRRAEWEQKGYELPGFDREAATAAARKAPKWIHFGAGNIFRAFPAVLLQTLLDSGEEDTGLIVCEGFDPEIIQKAYRPFDNLSLLAVLECAGTVRKKVVGSVVESLIGDPAEAGDWQRLIQIFEAPSLQMASFTITEKGYSLTAPDGSFTPAAQADFEKGTLSPTTLMGKVAALCLRRYQAGAMPLALVSMDNCSHNGEKLAAAVQTIAGEWVKRGTAAPGFAAYLADPQKVSFPWSMIDKITPRPDAGVQKMLEADGFADTGLIITEKNTYTAPFVNAEEAQYLVVEDCFPAGRPALEKAGLYFTDRDTVNKVERMKVCTCLNPLHTALAIFGCLLGFDTIYKEMQDDDLRRLVSRMGYEEGMPVVTDPGILSPQSFIREVLEVRLPNPFMPDTPQRIATDTSQKLSIRFGETIKAYLADGELDVQSLHIIPLVLAGWCRYLMGIDDNGSPFPPSPDPLLDTVRPLVAGISLGDKGPFLETLRPILENQAIFGVDLFAAGLAQRVADAFAQLVSGQGAVRAALHKAAQA